MVQTYDGGPVVGATVGSDGTVTLSIFDDQTQASLLVSQTTTEYDNDGNVFETDTYDVTPNTGEVSSATLVTKYYYDLDGNLVAESDPGGLWTKDDYNGAGELVAQWTTDGSSGTSYTAALGISGDVVLEQTNYDYDPDGNLIETIDSQRSPAASPTATGPLQPVGGVPAVVYYSASYYDAAGRDIADVDVGAVGPQGWSRPPRYPPTALGSR